MSSWAKNKNRDLGLQEAEEGNPHDRKNTGLPCRITASSLGKLFPGNTPHLHSSR